MTGAARQKVSKSIRSRTRPCLVFILLFLLAWPADDASALAGETRSLRIEYRYVLIPVAKQGEAQMLHVKDGDHIVYYSRISLGTPGTRPLYWAPVDVSAYANKKLTLALPAAKSPTRVLDAIEQSDTLRLNEDLYKEADRPQFHFSTQRGWINDPNGLVWFDGEYHLFYQHNPFGTSWGNMTWGHATSRDLVHWKELGDALHPDALGSMFSGSAVIDHQNTAGFQTGHTPSMVAFYTAAGRFAPAGKSFTQCLAYSHDRGRTWTKFDDNPVVDTIASGNRDPKVFWHQRSNQWVMVLYVNRGFVNILGSSDLKNWTALSVVEFPDAHECPELFELPVNGDSANTRWVIWEGGGRHRIGHFDGETFTPESDVLPSEWGANCYAAQTWNDVPDGRRILIGWMRARVGRDASKPVYAGMPFNQQMSIPRELTLRTTPDGLRLFARPAREIETLREHQVAWSNRTLEPDDNLLSDAKGELLDIELVLEPRHADAVTLTIGNTPIRYESANGQLSCMGKTAPVGLADGRLKLRVLVDKTSIEVFANDGRYVMSFVVDTSSETTPLRLEADGSPAHVNSLSVWNLQSIWPPAQSGID